MGWDNPENDQLEFFDLAPAAMWLRDYSAIKDILDGENIPAKTAAVDHLIASPELAQRCLDAARVVRVNREAVELFEATPDTDFNSVMPRLATANSSDHFLRIIASLYEGAHSAQYQTIISTLRGNRRHVMVRLTVMKPDLSRVIVCYTDTTETRELQARLAHISRVSSMGMVAAGVAHELNNPLCYLQLNVDHLDVRLPETARQPVIDRTIHNLRDGLDRVIDITRRLRDLSKPRDDRSVSADLKASVDSALELTHHKVRQLAQVRVEFPPRPLVIRGRSFAITQAVVNLLSNAADAIEDAGDSDHHLIVVRAEAVGDRARLTVSDTGCGIPKSIAAAVFDPFVSTKTSDRGTGLGLAITRDLVEEMGGTLTLDSTGPTGTSFVAELPVVSRTARGTQIEALDAAGTVVPLPGTSLASTALPLVTASDAPQNGSSATGSSVPGPGEDR